MKKIYNHNLKKQQLHVHVECIRSRFYKKDLKVDVCSKCHPYWTGNLRKDTTGGRADKFKKKYGIE